MTSPTDHRAPVGPGPLGAEAPPERPERPFDEPWQARAFALAVLTVRQHDLPWDTFRDRLKAAIAAAPDRPYWESWLAALEGLVAALPPLPLRN